MARLPLPLPPTPPAFTPVKKEPDADTYITATAAARAPQPLIHKKPRRDRLPLPVTPTQPLLTPQTIPSGTPRANTFAIKRCGAVPTSIKREPDADAVTMTGKDAGGRTVGTPPRKKCRVNCLPETPGQQPIFTPQTTPPGISRVAGSSLDKWSSEQPGLTPTTTSIKREPGTDAGRDARGKSVERRRRPYPHARPTAAETPTSWLNRGRLGRLLHDLARTHRWRDAAGVLSVLLPGIQHPDSFEEVRSIFMAGLDIHRQLAENDGVMLGGRSRYYRRTEKIFDVWIRRLVWLPTCAKKHLVKLELALFYLSQGNINNAYNSLRALIAKDGLQMEPTLNLLHGLISYDKWYSGLPKDMQLEELDVYNEACSTSAGSNAYGESGLQDSSDDSIDVDEASFRPCSSESSISNGNIDKKHKIFKKYVPVYPVKENDSIGSEVKEVGHRDFQSVFFNTFDTPTCGLEKSLLPLRLKHAAGTLNHSFDSYWKYKSTPNSFYEDAVRCLRVALHSSPPVMAALLPLIQILLLGDKLKEALSELENICHSSTTALPFRLRGRLVEYYDQNQVSTIFCCYEEALRRDSTCSYSLKKLIEMHRKGYYNTVSLLEAIALHLDSVNGKPSIWEELVSCFCRLFSHRTTDCEDRISCNDGDAAINASSSLSSVFCEQHTRESWKLRCKWWMSHHFSQNSYMSDSVEGDCKLLACKAACASHLYGAGFQYAKAAKSYLSEQEANKDEFGFLSRNMENSVKLLPSLEKLT